MSLLLLKELIIIFLFGTLTLQLFVNKLKERTLPRKKLVKFILLASKKVMKVSRENVSSGLPQTRIGLHSLRLEILNKETREII